jgi:aromatic ring-opening dioxygenase LigB subunit
MAGFFGLNECQNSRHQTGQVQELTVIIQPHQVQVQSSVSLVAADTIDFEIHFKAKTVRRHICHQIKKVVEGAVMHQYHGNASM